MADLGPRSDDELSAALPIPVLGLGTGGYPFNFDASRKLAALHAIELGYRHFDTGSLHQSEQAIGEVVSEALRRGLIRSRSDVFITSKLWCTDAQPHLVLPAIRESLRNMKMDYLDLYVLHWPMTLKPGARVLPVKAEDILPFDLKSVWEAMEECQRLGLAKSIGVCNFTRKKILELLEIAKIPPAVNQVELNPVWQQEKLREMCKEKGIHLIAYSPIGGTVSSLRNNQVMESEVLKDIAKARGKSVAQVSLRWIYEQGVKMIVRSSNRERLKENMEIFDWELTDEDHQKISQIPQCKRITTRSLLSPEDPCKSSDLADLEIID